MFYGVDSYVHNALANKARTARRGKLTMYISCERKKMIRTLFESCTAMAGFLARSLVDPSLVSRCFLVALVYPATPTSGSLFMLPRPLPVNTPPRACVEQVFRVFSRFFVFFQVKIIKEKAAARRWIPRNS